MAGSGQVDRELLRRTVAALLGVDERAPSLSRVEEWSDDEAKRMSDRLLGLKAELKGRLLAQPGGHAPDGEDEDPDMKKWRQELAFFREHRLEMLRDAKSTGRFVAVRNGRIVDSDDDDFALVKRARKAYPGEVVLVVRADGSVPTVELPSPEIPL